MAFISKSEKHLGTVFLIKLPETNEDLFDSCFSLLFSFEKKYTRFSNTSFLTELNSSLNVWRDIDDETYQLFSFAKNVAKSTNNAFDVGVKSQLDNLGYDSSLSFVEKKQPFMYIQDSFILHSSKKKVYLKKEVDFGGLGKGFVIDKLVSFLEEKNVSSFFISGGGDIYAKGSFDVFLENPLDPSYAIGKVVLDNCAIASSSSNRRSFGRYHHLLDAKTGLPANEILAIYVLGKTALEADAYATAFFTAGLRNAIELSEHLMIPILLITSDKKVYCSNSFVYEQY